MGYFAFSEFIIDQFGPFQYNSSIFNFFLPKDLLQADIKLGKEWPEP